MTTRIRWTVDAVRDLETQLEYISERNPRAAARLADRVLKAEITLKEHPQSGHFDDELGIREYWVPGTRIKLIYVQDGDLIEIIATFHTSRDPKKRPSRN